MPISTTHSLMRWRAVHFREWHLKPMKEKHWKHFNADTLDCFLSLKTDYWVTMCFLYMLVHGASVGKNSFAERTGKLLSKVQWISVSLKEKINYQISNVAIFRFTFKFAFLEKFLPQSVQGNISMGPLCFSFLCPNRDLFEVNNFPQSGQIKRSILAWTSLDRQINCRIILLF